MNQSVVTDCGLSIFEELSGGNIRNTIIDNINIRRKTIISIPDKILTGKTNKKISMTKKIRIDEIKEVITFVIINENFILSSS